MRFQSLITAAFPTIILAAPQPIVGGSIANSQDLPFIASLEALDRHLCGGTLINRNTIVTAAHCSESRTIGSVSNLRVRLGTLTSESEGTVVGVSAVYIHPNYKEQASIESQATRDFDIAIWKLSEFVEANQIISYASLPRAFSNPADGAMHTIAGWGTTDSAGLKSRQLLKVDLPIVSRSSCQSSHPTENINLGTLCAGYPEGGRGACVGDDGGPLVSSSKEFIGIVSGGRGCAEPNLPGIFTHVSVHLDFIKQFSS